MGYCNEKKLQIKLIKRQHSNAGYGCGSLVVVSAVPDPSPVPSGQRSPETLGVSAEWQVSNSCGKKDENCKLSFFALCLCFSVYGSTPFVNRTYQLVAASLALELASPPSPPLRCAQPSLVRQ